MPQSRDFTEEEARALLRKPVKLVVDTYPGVEEGSYGVVTTIDRYGVRREPQQPGEYPGAWEVCVKWDTDEDDEPARSDFIKEAFDEAVVVISPQERKR